jgi:hypothetical protein
MFVSEKTKPAEVRDERLDAEARRDKVVVVGEVADVELGEGFLQGKEVAVPHGVTPAGFVLVVVVAVAFPDRIAFAYPLRPAHPHRPRNRAGPGCG